MTKEQFKLIKWLSTRGEKKISDFPPQFSAGLAENLVDLSKSNFVLLQDSTNETDGSGFFIRLSENEYLYSTTIAGMKELQRWSFEHSVNIKWIITTAIAVAALVLGLLNYLK